MKTSPSLVWIRRIAAVSVAAASLTPAPSSATRVVDRLYLFGDDNRENPVVGALVDAKTIDPPFANRETIDGAGVVGGQQIVNLGVPPTPSRKPRYATITGRPDGVGGVGITFDGGDYLSGQRLGTPLSSISAATSGGTLDYSRILDRGMQFWARPAVVPSNGSGLEFDNDIMVADTNNHGALINSFGRYTMRYNGIDYPGVGAAAVATANQWAHIMVVTDSEGVSGSATSRVAPTSVMYVNGIAVSAVSGDYLRGIPPLGTVNDIPDTAPLVVGGRTATAAAASTVGTAQNFNGVIDDLELFLLGYNGGTNGLSGTGDFGLFDLATDNGYVSALGPANPLDLAGSDGLVTLADINVFANNWLSTKELNGVLVGDLETRARGDFNYDGVVDIADWEKLNVAFPALAAVAMQIITGAAVPEPSSLMMGAMAVVACGLGLRRSSR